MKSVYTSAIILLLLTSIGSSTGVYYPAGVSQHINVAQLGMGGLTITNSSNAHSLFYNPALLNRQEYILEITPLSSGFTPKALGAIGFILDHKDDFEDFEALTLEEQEKLFKDSESFDNKWVGVQATPYFGFVKNGYGYGLYSVSHIDFKIDQGVFVPSVSLRGFTDLVLGVGTGRLINLGVKSVEVGVTGRFVLRSIVDPMNIDATDAGDDVVDSILSDFQGDLLSFDKVGFGIDAGAIHSIKLGSSDNGTKLDLGVVVKDLISILDGYVVPNIKLGATAHLPLGSPPNFTGWSVGIELVDLMNSRGINMFQRINLGTELGLFSNYIKLRGGFHQGYPSFGAGFRVSIVNLDYAYFTRELGFKPGVNPESTHRFQLTFGL